jgi:hypothetical protein
MGALSSQFELWMVGFDLLSMYPKWYLILGFHFTAMAYLISEPYFGQ